MDLQDIRIEINQIDDEMRQLFEKRMILVAKVAEYKMAHNMEVFDEKREKEVIDNNTNKLKNDQLKPYYFDYIVALMDISKRYQKQLINRIV